ncbi:MAG: hypothetical protein Q7V57_03810 [Actinomycetota bacterium]|nr:hypothetical protein [Actinomycetota bacterium]
MTRATRLNRLFVSWVGVGIGVPLLVRAELGVAPFDVLNTGLNHRTGWSFGLCFIVMSALFFGTGYLLGAKLGWACLGGTLTIGLLVNRVLTLVPEQRALVPRSAYLLAGILIIAAAICLVVSTDLGPGPTEVVMLGLINRGMGVIPARWISDGTPLVVGAAMGGSIGVGTVAFAFGMGPMVKFGLRRLGYRPHVAAPHAG